ncbi:hypothetical protein ACQ4PT_012117 [Festuca glaucescens]
MQTHWPATLPAVGCRAADAPKSIFQRGSSGLGHTRVSTPVSSKYCYEAGDLGKFQLKPTPSAHTDTGTASGSELFKHSRPAYRWGTVRAPPACPPSSEFGRLVSSAADEMRLLGGAAAEDEGMALRKAEEAAARRCEAARWLRQMAPAAVEALPERPSEEEFGAALRNGLILCKVLNRVNPGTVTKVVENPIDAVQSSDGAAQSAIQYFENMRNFLVAVCEMNLLTFEASDIEKGGSSMKVVDCILCLKAYHEWKLSGGIGIWRYGAIVKIAPSSKRLPSHSSRFGGSADQNQQMLEFVHLLSEVSLEETRVKETQHSLFQQFVLRVVRAFLLEWSEADELPLDDMVLETILEQASKEFTILLVSHRNQVRSLLRKMMKDESGVCSKLELIETISKSLNETTLSLFSPLQLPCDSRKRLDDGGGLEHQQEELEKLKLSFNDMKSQVESTRAKWEEDLTRLESYFEAQNHNAYHKLLEENRKLYNQVQDLKGSIRVYCRVKPFPKTQPDQRSTVDHIGENGEIMIMNPEKQGKDGRKIFSFNKIFGPIVSQSEVYVDTQPLIRSVMDGYNVCIFAYGQTGSGKTYTMSGPDISAEETLGVNYRSLNDLFDISQNRSDTTAYDVRVQMIEIYNEQVRDLLMTDGSTKRYPFMIAPKNLFQVGMHTSNILLYSYFPCFTFELRFTKFFFGIVS